MNTIIVGLAVVAGTVYLINKCRLFGRKVEVGEGSTKTQNTASSSSTPGKSDLTARDTTQALSTREVEITNIEKIRLKSLTMIEKGIGVYESEAMPSSAFTRFIYTAKELFNKDDEIGEEVYKDICQRCIGIFKACSEKLFSGDLSYAKHKDNIEEFLDCLKKAYEMSSEPTTKKELAATAISFLFKIDLTNVKQTEWSEFLAPYEGSIIPNSSAAKSSKEQSAAQNVVQENKRQLEKSKEVEPSNSSASSTDQTIKEKDKKSSSDVKIESREELSIEAQTVVATNCFNQLDELKKGIVKHKEGWMSEADFVRFISDISKILSTCKDSVKDSSLKYPVILKGSSNASQCIDRLKIEKLPFATYKETIKQLLDCLDDIYRLIGTERESSTELKTEITRNAFALFAKIDFKGFDKTTKEDFLSPYSVIFQGRIVFKKKV